MSRTTSRIIRMVVAIILAAVCIEQTLLRLSRATAIAIRHHELRLLAHTDLYPMADSGLIALPPIDPRHTGRLVFSLVTRPLPKSENADPIADAQLAQRLSAQISGRLEISEGATRRLLVLPLELLHAPETGLRHDCLPLATYTPSRGAGPLLCRLSIECPDVLLPPQGTTLRLTAIGSPLWLIDMSRQLLASVIFGVIGIILYNVAKRNLRIIRQKKRPGRLAYVMTAYPLWSETFLRQDLQLLMHSDLDLHPVALFAGNIPAEEDWPQVPLICQTACPLPSPGHVPRVSRQAFNLLPATVRLRMLLWRHTRLRHRLRRQIQAMQASHIHAEFAGLGALLASRVAEDLGLSFSLGIHAADVYANYLPLMPVCRSATLILACNAAAARSFRDKCPELAGKVQVIHHGVILANWPFRPARPWPAVAGQLRLIFVGRLVPKKGIETLIRAVSAAESRADIPSLSLTIIGAGSLEKRLRDLAAKLGLADRLTWRGILDQPSILKALHESDLLCLPSLVDLEGNRDGLPNVILEAMAAGTPVLGTQAGGLSEILTPETGTVITEAAPELIVQGLADMLAQPDLVERRRQNARQAIENRFDALRLSQLRQNALRDAFS